MGLGLGASISLAIGIHYPERILSLVPCCCRARMVPDFASMWLQLKDLVKLGGIEKIVENTAQRWFSESFKQQFPEKLDAVRAMIRGTSQEGYLGVVSAFIGLDLER
jgi:3-oxoadipate enol-lactonase